MPIDTDFATFERELVRLVDSFGKRLAELKQSNKMVAQAFPRLSVGDVKKLPIATVNAKQSSAKARHDKLVLLVDKMLVLMPKLRAAKSDREKSVLQNAVSATDRQIDEIVYELYQLTPEEIALVEGAA